VDFQSKLKNLTITLNISNYTNPTAAGSTRGHQNRNHNQAATTTTTKTTTTTT
jgi:hypothetical protein